MKTPPLELFENTMFLAYLSSEDNFNNINGDAYLAKIDDKGVVTTSIMIPLNKRAATALMLENPEYTHVAWITKKPRESVLRKVD